MASEPGGRLIELISGARRVALVGLAKNTGKTQTLGAILAEHDGEGMNVGVTSIGRDGEEHDVIDARIQKPRIHLREGTLLATTAGLLRASGLSHERLRQTGVRTPLGEVVVARLAEAGIVEVAGPSGAIDVRAVSEAMEELGAERVLIDGAIDRRAASSPEVADGLVMATGAVLGRDPAQVVASTANAVELVRLPRAAGVDARAWEAPAGTPRDDGEPAASEHDGQLLLSRRLLLGAEPEQIAALLRAHSRADTLLVRGALGERFLEGLLLARVERAGRALRIVAADPTKVFLSRRGPDWYRRQGIAIEVLHTIELKAITVNPLSPQSHSFDSKELRELIRAAVADVAVVDVLDPSYGGGPG
ncbi:MAG: hypothetical protein E6G34_08005 [Actinobacteria bacterium]|nr:MAG: hypothetical protein E6G34_08005 [Actinomycetota bacterium]